MIFYLHDNLIDHLGSPSVKDCILALCLSHTQCRHIILASVKLISRSKKVYSDEPQIIKAMNHVLKNITKTSSLMSNVELFCLVDFKGRKPTVAKFNGYKCVKIPYKLINPSNNIWMESYLLGEFADDCKFYEKLAENDIDRRGLTSYRVRFKHENGGGGSTHTMYGVFQSERRPCICITDSDKKYPSDSVQGTASQVLHVNDVKEPLSNIMIVNVHEIENLAPRNLIDLGLSSQANYTSFSDALAEIQSIQRAFPNESFIDLKNGLNRFQMRSYRTSDPSLFNYFNRVLKRSGLVVRRDTYLCLSRTTCTTSKNCSCLLLHPIKSLKIIKGIANHPTCFVGYGVPPFGAKHWEAIGSKLFTWGCAYRSVI